MDNYIDETLNIKALTLGNHSAFHFIFTKYASKIKSFIYHIVKSHNVAEDLTQDIFVKLWIQRELLMQIHSFDAYIFHMAKNAALDYVKANGIRQSYANKIPLHSFEIHIEGEYFAREIEILIQLTVNQMPKQRRHIYEMSRHEGLKNDEIAKQLNISKKTVENHITLALREIKQGIIL